MTEKVRASGGCLCGAVRFEVTGPLRPVVGCHCEQCRRTSGHFVAATAARHADFRLMKSDGLKWYRSSPEARRGFCGVCGGNLFWEPEGKRHISIMAGTLDRPTSLQMVGHLFAGEARDYYRITDGLKQFPGSDHDAAIPAEWGCVGTPTPPPSRTRGSRLRATSKGNRRSC